MSTEEVIEGLRKSKNLLGPITPVLTGKDTMEIIDGRHRKRADPSWPEKQVEVPKDFPFPKDFYFLLLRVHANYRRPVSAKETQTALLRLASKLESHGFETEKIASKLAEITPYSLRTVERRLPAK